MIVRASDTAEEYSRFRATVRAASAAHTTPIAARAAHRAFLAARGHPASTKPPSRTAPMTARTVTARSAGSTFAATTCGTQSTRHRRAQTAPTGCSGKVGTQAITRTSGHNQRSQLARIRFIGATKRHRAVCMFRRVLGSCRRASCERGAPRGAPLFRRARSAYRFLPAFFFPPLAFFAIVSYPPLHLDFAARVLTASSLRDPSPGCHSGVLPRTCHSECLPGRVS